MRALICDRGGQSLAFKFSITEEHMISSRRKILWSGLLVIAILLVANRPIRAEENGSVFSSKESYDVYYYAGNSQAVIKNVEIIGMRTVSNVEFLVFMSHDFKLRNKEGYLRFSSVVAVLPTLTYRVEGSVLYQ